jgi:mono/diheme cytochrome c family protein
LNLRRFNSPWRYHEQRSTSTADALETDSSSRPTGTANGPDPAAGRERERGEDWNEIDYGPNETVDPFTGLAVDKGPGNYLTFVPQYFTNRTWGFEIIDNSRVAGVSKPSLIVNQYTTVDFLPGGVAFFRAFDRPGVTGYGWMNPGELVDRNVAICKPVPYPANGKLTNANGINGACTLQVKEYPGHGDLDIFGFPNGKNVPARPLVAGDIIEVSPSMFSTVESMTAKGDTGGIRYYSAEWTYVVGAGLRPWYGVQPCLNSVPLPAETLSGGLGSVSYNYTDNGLFMLQQPHNNVGMQNMQRFVEGRRLVHTNFTTDEHNEPGNDRYPAAAGLQGPRFNQSACIACHVNNGRSTAPHALNQQLDSMSVRVASVNAAGQQLAHSQYGSVVQMNAVSAGGVPQNWGTRTGRRCWRS